METRFQIKEIGEAVRDEAIEAVTDAVKVPFNYKFLFELFQSIDAFF